MMKTKETGNGTTARKLPIGCRKGEREVSNRTRLGGTRRKKGIVPIWVYQIYMGTSAPQARVRYEQGE